MRTVILVNRHTNAIENVTFCSVDRDADFVQPTDTHEVLRVPVDHPVIYEQCAFEAPKRIVFGAAWDRALKRKGREGTT